MMRSLWTSASGMTAQQTNVDTIANNLSNVNTTAYKKERLEFKSLLYQTMERADLDPANQTGRPVNLQVGLGVRPVATARIFDMGSIEVTNNKLDLALSGDGFFTILRDEDNIVYTRDGSFKVSPTDDGLMLTTSEGYPVLSTDGDTIVIPNDVKISALVFGETGELSYVDDTGAVIALDMQLDIVQFSNVQGLEAMGGNLYKATLASGEALHEADGETNTLTTLVQGAIEMSNVQVAEEMVKLIVAQRAYELNSKVIQSSDDMLQQAANLKR